MTSFPCPRYSIVDVSHGHTLASFADSESGWR